MCRVQKSSIEGLRSQKQNSAWFSLPAPYLLAAWDDHCSSEAPVSIKAEQREAELRSYAAACGQHCWVVKSGFSAMCITFVVHSVYRPVPQAFSPLFFTANPVVEAGQVSSHWAECGAEAAYAKSLACCLKGVQSLSMAFRTVEGSFRSLLYSQAQTPVYSLHSQCVVRRVPVVRRSQGDRHLLLHLAP